MWKANAEGGNPGEWTGIPEPFLSGHNLMSAHRALISGGQAHLMNAYGAHQADSRHCLPRPADATANSVNPPLLHATVAYPPQRGCPFLYDTRIYTM